MNPPIDYDASYEAYEQACAQRGLKAASKERLFGAQIEAQCRSDHVDIGELSRSRKKERALHPEGTSHVTQHELRIVHRDAKALKEPKPLKEPKTHSDLAAHLEALSTLCRALDMTFAELSAEAKLLGKEWCLLDTEAVQQLIHQKNKGA
ncbi:MAG: hypothetical protein JXK05_03920 [Campylobacterales bacterium]|nr:hypothetical protein [Campylobacterales bacterium]